MTSDRIKEIQKTTAYPDSVSVKQALLQVWNECEQAWCKEKLIEKYELENRLIISRRPDLDYSGDFSPDGIKFDCNSEFIADLKLLSSPLNEDEEINNILP